VNCSRWLARQREHVFNDNSRPAAARREREIPTVRYQQTSRSVSLSIELSVVVPTYNERSNVAELVRRLGDVLQGLRW